MSGVLLGFLCTEHAANQEHVRTRMDARTLRRLLAAVHTFAALHAEAGVLHVEQARLCSSARVLCHAAARTRSPRARPGLQPVFGRGPRALAHHVPPRMHRPRARARRARSMT